MKKKLLCFVLIATLAIPLAFSQLRFEIGANSPVSVGLASFSDGTLDEMAETISDWGIVPVLNLGLLFQADLSLVKIGVGAKIHSLILYSIGYPAAQVELMLGPIAIDASLGGYYFGYYGIGNVYGITQFDLLIADLSLWYGFGKNKNFRIGGGALGFVGMNLDFSTLPFIAYAGLKVVLD
jgi:hypothetical protein